MLAPRLATSLLVLVMAAPACCPASGADRTDPLTQAEELLGEARAGRLDSQMAEQAAHLLDHNGPFVRGIAEWAIATKVNGENDGQQAVWPAENPPAWFVKWSGQDGDFLLKCDYVRQAFVWSIHRDRTRLLESADKILRRARGAADEVEMLGASAERMALVAGQLDRLKQIRGQLAEQVTSNRAQMVKCR